LHNKITSFNLIKKIKYEQNENNPDDLIDIIEIDNSIEHQKFMEVMHSFDNNCYYIFKLIICTPFNIINRGSLEFGINYISDLIIENFDSYFNISNNDKPNVCIVCGMIHHINLTDENFNDMHERYDLCTYDQIVNRMTTCFSLL